MIDNQSLQELIQQQIHDIVEQKVSELLHQESWTTSIESRIVHHVQDRITAKFANLDTAPDLIESVKQSVAELFDQGRIPIIQDFVPEAKIATAIDSAVQALIETTVDNLVLDASWIQKIENKINQAMTDRLLRQLSTIDIDSYIVRSIDDGIDRWQNKLMANFRTNGITDQASTCELTVVDGAVVVTNGLASQTALVEQDLEVNGTAKIKNLVVTGTVNVDCRSWQELSENVVSRVHHQMTEQWRNDLVDSVLEKSKTQGINFDSILLDNEPLVQGTRLNAKIVDSQIETVGTLKKLRVIGATQLDNTMYITGNRVGINTGSPDSALSIWDEEVCMSIGKLSLDTAFVGTSRKQKLAMGVNRQSCITVDTEGLVWVKNLQIHKWRISHSDNVPGWSGGKGDFVINSSPTEAAPFAWICLGGYRWLPLKP